MSIRDKMADSQTENREKCFLNDWIYRLHHRQ